MSPSFMVSFGDRSWFARVRLTEGSTDMLRTVMMEKHLIAEEEWIMIEKYLDFPCESPRLSTGRSTHYILQITLAISSSDCSCEKKANGSGYLSSSTNPN